MNHLAFEAWQLEQLAHLAASDPSRVERALEAVWKSDPELFRFVVLSAVDSRQISYERGAEILGMTTAEVEASLESLRKDASWEQYIEFDEESSTARMVANHVPVWEVVREHRRLGSVAELCETFPSLSKGALAAALRYAEAHAPEIQAKIVAYESYLDKRRAVIRS